jgi:hypothetical protein
LVFRDDGAPLHRTKETEEALNAVCITVSSTCLHSPANHPTINPIEQVWGMEKSLINREQCSTPEELYVRAPVAWDAISIESVNGIVVS